MRTSNQTNWAQLLNHQGYLVVQNCDLKCAQQHIQQLGEIVHACEVKIKPNARTYISSASPIPPHTDHPQVRWIVWQCEAQDSIDGSSLLFDTRTLLSKLADRQLKMLSSIQLHSPSNIETLEYDAVYPVLNRTTLQFYYADWLIKNLKKEEMQFMHIIKSIIEDLINKTKLSIRLQPNQMLIIDNHRMLHFRDYIQDNSTRKLHRFWVR